MNDTKASVHRWPPTVATHFLVTIKWTMKMAEERDEDLRFAEILKASKAAAIRVWWPNMISDVDLWRQTGQEQFQEEIQSRRWYQIGHTLRKEPNRITRKHPRLQRLHKARGARKKLSGGPSPRKREVEIHG